MVGFLSGGQRRKIERREGNLRAMAPPTASADGTGGADGAPAAVAQYLADMTAQLESMADDAGLDLLAYFLALARLEAEERARGPLADARAV